MTLIRITGSQLNRQHIASAPELKAPVVALSLGGLRRRIQALMLPDEVRVVLQLDPAARLERDRRRQQAQQMQQ